MTTYTVRHTTSYRYASAVAFGEHLLLLRPRDGFDQRTLSASLDITPRPSELSWAEDASGNLVGTALFRRRAKELRLTSEFTVEVSPLNLAAVRLADHSRVCPFSYDADEYPDLARFLARQYPDPLHAVDGWARRILDADPERGALAFLRRLSGLVRRDFAYLRRDEQGLQAPATTLRLGRGTCRDFAVLMIEAARAIGFAARFASGYLHVRPSETGEALSHGSTHAWLQVYLPGGGWIDFDPTSGTVGNDDLIRAALCRDPAAATPVSGSYLGFPSAFTGLDVAVTVRRRIASEAGPASSRLRA